MKRTRALLALMPVAMIAGLLTGCTPGGASAIEGITCAPAGDVSKSLEVKGDFGASDLKLTTKTPLKVDALESSTLISGDGEKLKQDDQVTSQLTIISGADGKTVSSEKTILELHKDKMVPWALEVVACSSVGDRIVAAAPVKDVLGDNAASFQLNEDDTLVMVFDIVSAEKAKAEPGTLEPSDLLKKAEGKAQELPAGLPTVVLAEDGSPTITMPEGATAPDKLTVQTLIKGDGEKVKEGDRVYVHYRGVIWRTGEEFDSSWSRGAPIDFLTTGVIGGFSQALVGQTVGSQVMSIVPAEDGGYGAAGLQQMGHEPDDVMVFVLDILGTVHAE